MLLHLLMLCTSLQVIFKTSCHQWDLAKNKVESKINEIQTASIYFINMKEPATLRLDQSPFTLCSALLQCSTAVLYCDGRMRTSSCMWTEADAMTTRSIQLHQCVLLIVTSVVLVLILGLELNHDIYYKYLYCKHWDPERINIFFEIWPQCVWTFQDLSGPLKTLSPHRQHYW